MKLVTFTHDGQTRTGALVDDYIVDLHAADDALPASMLG